MPKTVKLNSWEQEELKKQTEIINIELEKKRQPKIKESELVHKILKEKIRKSKVDGNGSIIIE